MRPCAWKARGSRQLRGAHRDADRPRPECGQPRGGSQAHSAWQGNTVREGLLEQGTPPPRAQQPVDDEERRRLSGFPFGARAGCWGSGTEAERVGAGGWGGCFCGRGQGRGTAGGDRGVARSHRSCKGREGRSPSFVTPPLLSGPQAPCQHSHSRSGGSIPFPRQQDGGPESTPGIMTSAAKVPLSPAPWGRLTEFVTPGRWSPVHGVSELPRPCPHTGTH